MAYQCDLGSGQRLSISNQGKQTAIELASQGTGQQQSQQSLFATGEWSVPPTIFRTATELILRIQTAQGETFILIQPDGLSILTAMRSLVGAEILPLQEVTETAPSPMEPMEPLPPLPSITPMQMSKGETRLEPMAMRMGNMQMQMGTPPAASSSQRFCPQCGEQVEDRDRFCAHCGNRLTEPT